MGRQRERESTNICNSSLACLTCPLVQELFSDNCRGGSESPPLAPPSVSMHSSQPTARVYARTMCASPLQTLPLPPTYTYQLHVYLFQALLVQPVLSPHRQSHSIHRDICVAFSACSYFPLHSFCINPLLNLWPSSATHRLSN